MVLTATPVSDREFIVKFTNKTSYLTSLSFCESWIRDGRGAEIIPAEMRPGFEDTPVCAARWHSLAAQSDAQGMPKGAEDFFSSDLSDAALAETFGRLPAEVPLAVLYSEKDEFVPEYVDKEALVRRWGEVVEAHGGRFHGVVVKGANHSLDDVSAEVVERFVGELKGFLESVTGTTATVNGGQSDVESSDK